MDSMSNTNNKGAKMKTKTRTPKLKPFITEKVAHSDKPVDLRYLIDCRAGEIVALCDKLAQTDSDQLGSRETDKEFAKIVSDLARQIHDYVY